MSNGFDEFKDYCTCCDGLAALHLFWKACHIWKTARAHVHNSHRYSQRMAEFWFWSPYFFIGLVQWQSGNHSSGRCCANVAILPAVCLVHKCCMFGLWGNLTCWKNPVVVVGSKMEVSVCVCVSSCGAWWWSNCYQISSPENPERWSDCQVFPSRWIVYTGHVCSNVPKKCVELDS